TQSIGVDRSAALVAAELSISRGLEMDWIDIGGGFFGSQDGSPTFDDYIAVIRQTLEDVVDVDRTQLIVEPGGSLVAVPVEFHAGVIDVMEAGSSWFVVTDSCRTNIDTRVWRK